MAWRSGSFRFVMALAACVPTLFEKRRPLSVDAMIPAVGHGAGDGAVAERNRTVRTVTTARRDAMDDLKIARITGVCGLTCVALTGGQFPLWLVGSSPSVYD